MHARSSGSLRRFLANRARRLIISSSLWSSYSYWSAGFYSCPEPLFCLDLRYVVYSTYSETISGALRNIQRRLRGRNENAEPAGSSVFTPVRFSVPGILGPARPAATADAAPESALSGLLRGIAEDVTSRRLVFEYRASGEWLVCIQGVLVHQRSRPLLVPEATGQYPADAAANLVNLLRGSRLVDGKNPPWTVRCLPDDLYVDDCLLA